MIEVSATKLRNHLFDYLDRVSEGETIVIRRNNQEVARLVPTQQVNWREKMHIEPKLLVAPEELIQPIEEIWASRDCPSAGRLAPVNQEVAGGVPLDLLAQIEAKQIEIADGRCQVPQDYGQPSASN